MTDISDYNNGVKNPDLSLPHRKETETVMVTLGDLIKAYNDTQANLKIAHDLNEKYRTALEFYADKEKYESIHCDIKDVGEGAYSVKLFDSQPDILQDKGGHAREALK